MRASAFDVTGAGLAEDGLKAAVEARAVVPLVRATAPRGSDTRAICVVPLVRKSGGVPVSSR